MGGEKMPNLLLDTSTIIKCIYIKHNAGIDIFYVFDDLFDNVDITKAISNEIKDQKINTDTFNFRIVSPGKIPKEFLIDMDVIGKKNLGEAEAIWYCIKNKKEIFITDDIGAFWKGKEKIDDRILYFIPFLIEESQEYFSRKEMLVILNERHKMRKFTIRLYSKFQKDIKQKFWK